jgi:Uma2 family endonuclease
LSARVRNMTAEELLRVPDDGRRYELVRGELRTMAPVGHPHGRIAMRIAAQLFQHVEERGLGTVYAAETGFVLGRNPDTVRAPDAAFVRRERVEEVEETEGYWPGAPDLAVEVVSPGDAYAEVEGKVAEWLRAGARMVIVVDPSNRAVKIHRGLTDVVALTEDDEIDGTDVVQEWRLPVRRLFGD